MAIELAASLLALGRGCSRRLRRGSRFRLLLGLGGLLFGLPALGEAGRLLDQVNAGQRNPELLGNLGRRQVALLQGSHDRRAVLLGDSGALAFSLCGSGAGGSRGGLGGLGSGVQDRNQFLGAAIAKLLGQASDLLAVGLLLLGRILDGLGLQGGDAALQALDFTDGLCG